MFSSSDKGMLPQLLERDMDRVWAASTSEQERLPSLHPRVGDRHHLNKPVPFFWSPTYTESQAGSCLRALSALKGKRVRGGAGIWGWNNWKWGLTESCHAEMWCPSFPPQPTQPGDSLHPRISKETKGLFSEHVHETRESGTEIILVYLDIKDYVSICSPLLSQSQKCCKESFSSQSADEASVTYSKDSGYICV